MTTHWGFVLMPQPDAGRRKTVKTEPSPDSAVDFEKAAVAVDDVLDDREAEPGAAHLARARGVDPVKALGQPRQVLARDAVAAVAHRDRDKGARTPLGICRSARRGLGADGDLAFRRGRI